MGAIFDDAALVDDDDAVESLDSGEAMGYDYGGFAFHEGKHGILDKAFTLAIEG